ncbi:tetratricopeptide repeat protein [Alienimonas sp. DA493]|uniref:tetratricopeptide repeat protein n=1 Tax=Alienimonas sp. DA493 TaxID=3373605 RepID=UPI003754F6F6
MGLFRRRPDLLGDADDFSAPPWRVRLGRSLRGAAGAPVEWVRTARQWPRRFWGQPAEDGGRSWGRVAGAFPAAAAGVGLVTFAFVGHHQRSGLAREYEIAAREAAAEGDADAVVLLRRRLGELGQNGERDRLQLAAALSAAGRDAEALELLTGLLGGPDDPGYAPAHLLFAHKLLEEPDAGETDDEEPQTAESNTAAPSREARRRQALRHLTAALEAAPDDDRVAGDAASLLIKAGAPAAAAPLLERLAAERPEIWPDLMRLYVGLGRPEDAARAAEAATPVLQNRLNRNPLDRDARLRLADALVRNGRFDDAVSTLAAGRSLHPDGNVDRLLAAVHVGEYDRSVAARDGRLGRRLLLLERALKYDAGFGPALERLATFAATAAAQFDRDVAAPTVEDARQLLERMLASGEAPAGVHFALGLNALQADDREKAFFHFERAHQLDPKLAEAANNLAYLLSQQDDPDLERALAVADAAVAAAPNHPQVRHTRGVILAALDRPEDALLEYERAMERGLTRSPEVRAEVADLYDRLGRPELAESFRNGPAPSSAE